MPSSPVRQSITGLSSTSGFPLWFPDVAVRPFSVAVSAVINSTTISYNVECSLDYTGSSTFISTAATWFSSALSAATSNALASFGFPVSALRLNVVSGSSTGTVAATFVQAG
jgi:hypothetical protein